MDSIDIILLILIAYTVYIIIRQRSTFADVNKLEDKKVVSDKSDKRELMDEKMKLYPSYPNDVLNELVSWDRSHSGSSDSGPVISPKLKPNYLNIQFHNDYRDVLTALNNLVPDRKQLFNLANIPVVYSEPDAGSVKNMVNDFIVVLNSNLATKVPDYRHPNTGWDEAIPDPTIRSGWDTTQQSLGLPTSLYDDPAKRSPVKLVAIKMVRKYETDDEIKFSIDIVLQKENVNDQMIIRAEFVQDKRPLMDEGNFFTTSMIELRVTIENIFIIGFLSDEGPDSQKEFDGTATKFYDYNELEFNGMTDPRYIQKILMEKYRQRNEEMENRTAMLDEEARDFHRTLPTIYDFSNIRGTQSIFDDINYQKTFE